ncbi:hypothetical protein V3H18_02385 [Methylocystis sp. 9N]|uniref:Uncharacterized protein n=1 Tax=Methylocystis borbori TaxID=3118750 RepID=A0ABU7XDT7_9HYPH
MRRIALRLFDQERKLLLKERALYMMNMITFLIEAFDKIRDAIALARAGEFEGMFQGCLIFIHGAPP